MTDRKDEALDRLLRQAAHLRGATPAGACPDAEQLAAFVSGSLRAAEREACETHVAGCGRCLRLVATLARTEAAPATAVSWWRPANWTWWLVPATAVATAVALWVNVSPDRNPERTEREPATVAVDQHAAAEPTPAIPPNPTPGATSQRKAPDASKPALSAKEAANTRAPEVRARRSESTRADERPGQPAREEKVVAAPPAARAPLPPPPPQAAPVQTAVQELSRVQERSGAALDRIAALSRDAAGKTEVVSPDPAIRWRFSGPAIERSTDSGSTWTTQFTAPAPLLAGAATSPLVAWMVGRNGTVLQTVDGQQWQRMPFPETVDLVAVRARSDREADVIAADGRTFRTSDGGKSWSLVNR